MAEEHQDLGVFENVRLAYGLALFFLRAVSYSADIFLRRHSGVRHISIIGAIVIFFILSFISLPGVGDGYSLFLDAYAWTFLLMAFWQKAMAYRRRWRGVQIHSFSMGRPWALWRFLPGQRYFLTERFYEPAFCFAVGLAVGSIEEITTWGYNVLDEGITWFAFTFLGESAEHVVRWLVVRLHTSAAIDRKFAWYLQFSGVCMFIWRQKIYAGYRESVLDLQDARMDAERTAEIMSESPSSAREPRGYRVRQARRRRQ